MTMSISFRNEARARRALEESPALLRAEMSDFLVRAMAVVRKRVWVDPWRVGKSGGGVPVDTGNLRQSHMTEFRDLEAVMYPRKDLAPYAEYVHAGTKFMEARPWLDFAKAKSAAEINKLLKQALERVAAVTASKI